MLLAIDAGNTNTVFAVYKGDTLSASWRCQTAAARTADEYAAFIDGLFRHGGIEWKSIKHVIVSSVVPEANFHLRRFTQKYLNTDPLFVDNTMAGIEVVLDKPDEVGADRLVNSVAVVAHYQYPAIVVDFGTATTFDVIDAKGRYCGGAIAPGVNLSLDALHRAAAKLPRVNVGQPNSVIGTNTTQAMRSGIYWGYVGMIEGILSRMESEMGVKPFVIATGGLAPLFSRSTPQIQTVDEDLTLKGLLLIHQRNKV